MPEPFQIYFSSSSVAIAIQPTTLSELEAALHSLGFQESRPVIVVIGGASELEPQHIARLRTLFVKVLAPLAEAWNAIVIDGGTNTGVMRMMGTARRKIRAKFPLVGVLPVGVATLPHSHPPSMDAAPLEPHHTHFVLVPGTQWGDESTWMAQTASAIANGFPTVTILINGGEITWKDAAESVEAGRPIVVVGGSGRAADALVAALNGKVTDGRAKKLLASGLLQAVDLENGSGLADAVQTILSGQILP